MLKFSNYALWFNLKKHDENTIIDGLKEIHEQLMDTFKITPEIKFNFEDMFLKIGEDFYLIKVVEGLSPGDISGMFSYKYLDKDEQVMAILISRDYYLPYQGVSSVTHEQLAEWHSFPDKYELIRK